MTRETADILRKAKALIDTPEKWSQGAKARDVDGNKVYLWSERAVRYCSCGAIDRLIGKGKMCFYMAMISILDEIVGGSIVEFNDTHTHSEVMSAFDRAIQQEEQGE